MNTKKPTALDYVLAASALILTFGSIVLFYAHITNITGTMLGLATAVVITGIAVLRGRLRIYGWVVIVIGILILVLGLIAAH